MERHQDTTGMLTWISVDDCLPDPSCAVLCTNCITGDTNTGHMSHVWLARLQKETRPAGEKETSDDDDDDRAKPEIVGYCVKGIGANSILFALDGARPVRRVKYWAPAPRGLRDMWEMTLLLKCAECGTFKSTFACDAEKEE